MRYLIAFCALLSSSLFAVEFESGNSGGAGGGAFFDDPPANYSSINSITLCGGTYVDSIEVRYENQLGQVYSYGKHGGGGGSCSTLYFWSGEHIVSITGRSGRLIDSLAIVTNYGRVLKKGGNGGDASFKYTGNQQFQIAGFKGRSGSLIDAIGVVYFQLF